MQLLAIALATVIPLAILIIIRALDLYQTGAFSAVLSSVAWGALAFVMAYVLNTSLYQTGWFGEWSGVARFVAPPLEEALKAGVLFALVRRADFSYLVDGAIYGFAAGVGFAVVENYQYIFGAPASGLLAAAGRVISTNLIHACATGLVGVSLGLARFQTGPRRWGLSVGGWAAAVLLHAAFNTLVYRTARGPVLLYASLTALTAMALIVGLILLGLAQSRGWIEETLGIGDRVTPGEAHLVRRLEAAPELLGPLRATFGPHKATQVEMLLLAQAHLGIQRAALQRLPTGPTRQAVQQEIDGLVQTIDRLRRDLGLYTMLAVRQIAPPGRVPLWTALEDRLRANGLAGASAAGINVFAVLGQRIAAGQNPPDPTHEV